MSSLEQRVIDLGKQRDRFEREAKAWRELAESRLKEINELATNAESFQCAIEALISGTKSLEQERDALAAHVERLESEITGIINDSVGVSGYHMNGDIASWQEFDIENILEQSPQTSLAERDANLFENASIPRHAKAGCIGEFKVFVEDGNVCPECIQEYNPDCEVCMGESNENGACDLEVDVPWNTCKEIWKAMNKIKAEEIRNGKGGE